MFLWALEHFQDKFCKFCSQCQVLPKISWQLGSYSSYCKIYNPSLLEGFSETCLSHPKNHLKLPSSFATALFVKFKQDIESMGTTRNITFSMVMQPDKESHYLVCMSLMCQNNENQLSHQKMCIDSLGLKWGKDTFSVVTKNLVLDYSSREVELHCARNQISCAKTQTIDQSCIKASHLIGSPFNL